MEREVFSEAFSEASSETSFIEILAPAGSEESLTAAVRSGADAVYLGGSRFSARASAKNFDDSSLRRAVCFCHARGVKVYLALNTLLLEEELPQALELASYACALSVDGILIQDLGLLRILKKCAPTLPLHASTQTSIQTPAGVRLLKEAGCSRVVLSREMSLKEMKEASSCAGCAGIELEAFVHGALCMSVSGQCYFSSMLGGRSGNRGQCAQPCRLPFSCPGGTGHDLSLKDVSMIRRIEELARAGICCAKIEGRMKRPEYVAAAVSACRRAAQGEEIPPALLQNLEAVFSRSGFTTGYPDGKRGRSMFGVRTKEDAQAASRRVLGELRGLYREELQRIPVKISLFLREGKPARLEMQDAQGRCGTAYGEAPEKALHKPLHSNDCEKQLTKLGGTPFYAESVSCRLEEGIAFPASALNRLRREAAEELLRIREEREPIPFQMKEDLMQAEHLQPHKRGEEQQLSFRARFPSPRLPKEAVSCEICYIPWETEPADWLRLQREGFSLGLEIPRGLFGMEQAVKKCLSAWKRTGFRHVWAGTLDALKLAKDEGLCVHGGFSLNAVNSQSLLWLEEAELADTELSFELSLGQAARLKGNLPRGALVYGRLPLMLARNCPAANGPSGCLRCKERGRIPWLTDRKGIRFPVQCTGSCAEVLNSVPLELSDRLSSSFFNSLDFVSLRFTTESIEEQGKILQRYFSGKSPQGDFTRGLSKRGFGA